MIFSDKSPKTPDPKNQPSQTVRNMIELAKTFHKEKQYDEEIDLLLKAVEIEAKGRKDPKVLGQLWCKLSVVYQDNSRYF